MINWTKIIPRWSGEVIEPPEDKKDIGYLAGDKPPAKWENWLRKGTYDAITENRQEIENVDSSLGAHKAEIATQSQLGHIKLTENWIQGILENGWIYSSTGTGNRYCKDGLGVVRVELSVVGGTVGSTIYTLPVGYRPSNFLFFGGRTHEDGNKPAIIVIRPDGRVEGGSASELQACCSFKI